MNDNTAAFMLALLIGGALLAIIVLSVIGDRQEEEPEDPYRHAYGGNAEYSTDPSAYAPYQKTPEQIEREKAEREERERRYREDYVDNPKWYALNEMKARSEQGPGRRE